jgi:hypothetical protein
LLSWAVGRLSATLLSWSVRRLRAALLSRAVRRLSVTSLRLPVRRLCTTLLRLPVLRLRTLLLPVLPRSILRARPGLRPLLLTELSRLSGPSRLTEVASLFGVGAWLELSGLLRPPLLRLLGLRLLRRPADRLPRFCRRSALLSADLLLRIRLLPSRRLRLLALNWSCWLALRRPVLQRPVLRRPRLRSG